MDQASPIGTRRFPRGALEWWIATIYIYVCVYSLDQLSISLLLGILSQVKLAYPEDAKIIEREIRSYMQHQHYVVTAPQLANIKEAINDENPGSEFNQQPHCSEHATVSKKPLLNESGRGSSAQGWSTKPSPKQDNNNRPTSPGTDDGSVQYFYKKSETPEPPRSPPTPKSPITPRSPKDAGRSAIPATRWGRSTRDTRDTFDQSDDEEDVWPRPHSANNSMLRQALGAFDCPVSMMVCISALIVLATHPSQVPCRLTADVALSAGSRCSVTQTFEASSVCFAMIHFNAMFFSVSEECIHVYFPSCGRSASRWKPWYRSRGAPADTHAFQLPAGPTSEVEHLTSRTQGNIVRAPLSFLSRCH